jgi:hypothetical protein
MGGPLGAGGTATASLRAVHTFAGMEVMELDGNDMRSLPVETRGRAIASLFAPHGVRSSFIVRWRRRSGRSGKWEIGRAYPTCWQNGERRPKRRLRGNTLRAAMESGAQRQQWRAVVADHPSPRS